MNDMAHGALAEHVPHTSAFRFTGTWQEFAPIALTNLLLTIVTLGIYRFWAQARVRRYLWSRTEFIDDALEWTGTGREMFLGFLVIAAVIVPVLLVLQFGLEALILRGQGALAGVIAVSLYGGLFYLAGVALFRALRYRLSRTLWHGIRGGSEHTGWAYGANYLWKSIAGFFAAGLLVPWSMTQLWNDRWNAMSFGPHHFEAYSDTEGLMGRWVLVLLTPFLLLAMVATLIAALTATGSIELDTETPPSAGLIAIFAFVPLAFYALVALIGVGYYAAYFRKVIASTSLGDLRFAFDASSKDWLMLFLGNLGLAIVTLGIGVIFWSYRNWSFFIRHLEAYGEIDPAALTQSSIAATGDAEGLAGLFDVGAI